MNDYRDIVNPITARDWFLHNLFTDTSFNEVRSQWRQEINDIDSGPAGNSGLPFLEQEKITDYYVNKISEKFGITTETARDGLSYTKWNNAFNKSRMPSAKIVGEKIVITVGADTRLKDLEEYWKVWISVLQEKLARKSKSRSVPAEEPSLGYAIYKSLQSGERMVDVHKRYLHGELDGRKYNGHKMLDVNEFRKYYKDIVKGHIKTS